MENFLALLPILSPIVIFIIGLIIAHRMRIAQESNLKLQNERIKHDFFKYFNERYDKLNNELNRIYYLPEGKISKEVDEPIIMDYLNLCSEEFYYYSKGIKSNISIIEGEVFNNWCKGMKHYFLNPNFNKILIKEMEDENNKESYYNFLQSDCIKEILK